MEGTLRVYCLIILAAILLQTGYAFRIYRIYGDSETKRDRPPDNGPAGVSPLDLCIDETCGERKNVKSIRDLCLLHCLLRMEGGGRNLVLPSTSHVAEKDLESVLGLRSREVRPLGSCIEAQCVGNVDYAGCIYSCLEGNRNFSPRDFNSVAALNRPIDKTPSEGWGWKSRQSMDHASNRLNKRVIEPCICHPGVQNFPQCIKACKRK